MRTGEVPTGLGYSVSAAAAAADDVPAHLTCSVCLDAPPGRVEQCPRGHILCAHAPAARARGGGWGRAGAGAGWGLGAGAGEGEGSCLAKLRMNAVTQHAAPLCPVCRCQLPAELQRSLVADRAWRILLE